MPLESILNYRNVAKHIASSGQPHATEFRIIANAGFRHIINLAMPNSEGAIEDEGYRVTALGLSYFHIPVPFEAPLPLHLRLFCQLMEALAEEKVWVHCAKNYRASAFLYQYYRLVLKKDRAVCAAVMLPGWEPDAIWHRFLQLDTCR